MLLLYEALRDLRVREDAIETPLETTGGMRLADEIVVDRDPARRARHDRRRAAAHPRGARRPPRPLPRRGVAAARRLLRVDPAPRGGRRGRRRRPDARDRRLGGPRARAAQARRRAGGCASSASSRRPRGSRRCARRTPTCRSAARRSTASSTSAATSARASATRATASSARSEWSRRSSQTRWSGCWPGRTSTRRSPSPRSAAGCASTSARTRGWRSSRRTSRQYDHVNLQVALDALAAGRRARADRAGARARLPGEPRRAGRRRRGQYGDGVRARPAGVRPVDVGDRTISCLSSGLLLAPRTAAAGRGAARARDDDGHAPRRAAPAGDGAARARRRGAGSPSCARADARAQRLPRQGARLRRRATRSSPAPLTRAGAAGRAARPDRPARGRARADRAPHRRPRAPPRRAARGRPPHPPRPAPARAAGHRQDADDHVPRRAHARAHGDPPHRPLARRRSARRAAWPARSRRRWSWSRTST